MSRYLVDTPTWIDFSKRIEPQASRLKAILDDTEHEVGVCDVIVAEFLSGVAPSERNSWRRFFSLLTYWDIPLAAAAAAGEDRYDFARVGHSLGAPDVLIAAAAREHNAVLITENPKDFPMPGITVISLR